MVLVLPECNYEFLIERKRLFFFKKNRCRPAPASCNRNTNDGVGTSMPVCVVCQAAMMSADISPNRPDVRSYVRDTVVCFSCSSPAGASSTGLDGVVVVRPEAEETTAPLRTPAVHPPASASAGAGPAAPARRARGCGAPLAVPGGSHCRTGLVSED